MASTHTHTHTQQPPPPHASTASPFLSFDLLLAFRLLLRSLSAAQPQTLSAVRLVINQKQLRIAVWSRLRTGQHRTAQDSTDALPPSPLSFPSLSSFNHRHRHHHHHWLAGYRVLLWCAGGLGWAGLGG
ncbi:hypothetical protein BKA81DRAFT_189451 [Phyllosticta paracitricarpa]|uniref:Uncharacterized protein n=1 Tax=Phyllosticta citricarpa TaxID=55181 RepID=A0ABR1MGR6_9PEZI